MYAARATTRTLQLQRGAFVSRHSALLRQSQSRGNAAAAVVNNGLKSSSSSSSSLKSSNNNGVDEAPPDFVRLGIQRMLEQAQQHNDNDSSYYKQNDSLSTEIENSKALQALELVQDQLEETSLCIADCREAVDAVSFQEEFQAADAALEQAVLSFTDWLEDARTRDESTVDVVMSYKALREANSAQIKLLRRQLDQLKADSVTAA